MSVCPKCGKEIAGDSNFCEHCGARIKRTVNKPLWTTLAFAAILCVILNAGLWLYFAYSPSPETQPAPQPAAESYESDNTEISDLQNRIDSLLQQNKTLRETNESLHSRNASLQSQKKKKKSENSNLAAKVQRYREMLNN